MAKRILIVEDDDDLRRMHRTVLQLAGFQVHEASDGLTALNLIDERPPDLVVLDLILPRIHGVAVGPEHVEDDGRLIAVALECSLLPQADARHPCLKLGPLLSYLDTNSHSRPRHLGERDGMSSFSREASSTVGPSGPTAAARQVPPVSMLYAAVTDLVQLPDKLLSVDRQLGRDIVPNCYV